MEIRLKIKETPSTPVAIVLNSEEKAVRHAIATFGMTCKSDYTAYVLENIPIESVSSSRCTLVKKKENDLRKMTVASKPIAIIFDKMLENIVVVVAKNGKAI